jgi:hypothetical protein
MPRPVTRRLERRQVNLCRLGAARVVVEQGWWLAVVAVLGYDRSAGRFNGRRSGEWQWRVALWASVASS